MPRPLSDLTVYFSAAITGNADNARVQRLLEVLYELGVQVVCEHVASVGPDGGAPGIAPSDPSAIHAYDMALMRRADCVVAEVTVASLGVGYEVREAWHQDIPVIAVAEPDVRVSGIIRGAPHVTFHRYESREDLVAAVRFELTLLAQSLPAR